MMTLALVLMFVAGMASGYVLKTIVLHRQVTGAMEEMRRFEPPCLVAGCTDRGKHSHLH
jgi:hypothetical protein